MSMYNKCINVNAEENAAIVNTNATLEKCTGSVEKGGSIFNLNLTLLHPTESNYSSTE